MTPFVRRGERVRERNHFQGTSRPKVDLCVFQLFSRSINNASTKGEVTAAEEAGAGTAATKRPSAPPRKTSITPSIRRGSVSTDAMTMVLTVRDDDDEDGIITPTPTPITVITTTATTTAPTPMTAFVLLAHQ